MIKNKLYFMVFLSVFAITSCLHQNKEQLSNLIELSDEFLTKDETNNSLKFESSDILPYYNKVGLIWTPFVLPTKVESLIQNSALLVGYKLSKDTFFPAPLPGQCTLLRKQNANEKEEKKLVMFHDDFPNHDPDINHLFFIIDKVSLTPFAALIFNSQGMASCFLPNSNYIVSYNYGSGRKEFAIDTNLKTEFNSFQFEPSAKLKIGPMFNNNIKNGDIIRIGRKNIDNNMSNNDNHELVATKIENDLFANGNTLARLMGVDEFYRTSFLVGSKPYLINLNIGNYKVFVIRKNELICTQEVDIFKNSTLNLACPIEKNKDIEEKIAQENDYKINFDMTFYPKRFNQNSYFLNWIMANQNYFMPILSTTEDEVNLMDDNLNYTFIVPLQNQNRFQKLFQNYDFQVNDISSILPLAGTSFQKLVQGAIPYANYTSLQFQNALDFNHLFLLNSQLIMTNGTDIKVVQPFLSNDGTLASSQVQKFRIRVSIPSWNSTNRLEMYIDGNLYKRWLLNRGSISQPFFKTFDEEVFEKKNFTVKFVTLGDLPLPDVIFGIEDYLPYARTQNYFVSIESR